MVCSSCRASAQIKKCTKLNGPGADHSHYPTLAVRIIRTIHLTMAQVKQKVSSPIPPYWGEGHIRVILELAVEAGWFSRCHRYCHGGFPRSYPFQQG